MTWNVDGVVFIHGSSIPQSNIFELMPELFKPHPDRHKPGFYELTKEIASLGLGHLINKTILRGLQREEKLENHTELYKQVNLKSHKWYYVGQ